MITVEEALELVHNNIQSINISITKPIEDALGCVTFEDIIAPINMPPFRQSAMDGYAVNSHDKDQYTLIGEIKAGDPINPNVKKGEGVRIFTGAPVPDTCDAVIIQEKVVPSSESFISMSPLTDQMNIRPMGEQVKLGQIALKKDTKITAGGIGFLAALGISHISVYQRPNISIVVTGNELVSQGTVLKRGQIFESNAKMLKATLKSWGFDKITIHYVDDNYEDTVSTLETAIEKSDVVIISGGISVGDYDFVGKALNELDVQQIFYKVKQKPGKPLFFGKKKSKIIFALPGNPAAALSCSFIYIFPALQRLMGMNNVSLARVRAESQTEIKTPGERAQFLKAIYKENKVSILEGQNSSMLQTFALANALVYVPETIDSINKNDLVEVLLLPVNI